MVFSLAVYSRIIEKGPEDDSRYRALIHQLPPAEQAAALLEAPPLTGTRRDALLAAVAEHIARLHGHPVPA